MKIGVMSASFKPSGDVPVSKDSLKKFSNILAVVSELILSILGVILSLVDDLLRLMSLITFTALLNATRSKENLFI